MRPLDQRVASDRARDGLVADGDVEQTVVAQQRPVRVALGERPQPIQERGLQRVDLDLLGLVDGTALGLADQQPRIVLREDHHPRGRLADLVQALGRRRPELDPDAQVALQILHPHGRLVGGGQALRERDPLLEQQRVSDHARQQVRHRFGGVARHAQIERLVDAAVHVGELDLDVVDGRRQSHRFAFTGATLL